MSEDGEEEEEKEKVAYSVYALREHNNIMLPAAVFGPSYTRAGAIREYLNRRKVFGQLRDNRRSLNLHLLVR